MEQEQYQLTAKGEVFRPDTAPDYVKEFDEAIAQGNETRELYERSVRTRAKQEVDAAEYQLQQIGELSQLSQTLMDSLVNTQKKVNESQKAKGLADKLRERIGVEKVAVSQSMFAEPDFESDEASEEELETEIDGESDEKI